MPWLSTPFRYQLTSHIMSQQHQMRGVPNLSMLDSTTSLFFAMILFGNLDYSKVSE